jgi:hypothetical protein
VALYTAPAGKFAIAFVTRIAILQGGSISLYNANFSNLAVTISNPNPAALNFVDSPRGSVFLQPGAVLRGSVSGFAEFDYHVVEIENRVLP